MKKIALYSIVLVLTASCANQNGLRYNGATGASAGQNGNVVSTNAPSGQSYTQAALQQAIGDTVLFPIDQAYLTPQAMSVLDAQAQWLAGFEGAILIEGHADEQGTREYNLALGARRAAATRDYLVSRGVSASRLSVVTYGKERPLAVCSDESCWSKNRRSVTIVK